jgi:Protein of unknown function (DUF3570)
MKKKYLTLALLTASLYGIGQKPADSVYKKQRISKTQIQVLFSYYEQDGNHSAITGGIGTEYLHVYAPEFTITQLPDSLNTFQFNGGVDVITSASMDNIDFVVSSPSRVSARLHLSQGYSHLFRKSNLRAGINAGYSLEAAYMSIPLGLNLSKSNTSGSREFSGSLQCFFDDLRWGRLNSEYGKPVGLIYPVELRYKNWFNIYRRNSYNLDFAYYQVINQRMQFAVFPELVYQKGLLCTPYHRVYFNDGSTEKVENLPTERWKFPIAAQLNIFVGNRFIFRTYYRYYQDNFGIVANTVQLEMPIKISPFLTAGPLFRYSHQTAAYYFKPYKQHDTSEIYYTSDYDLSRFSSYKLGVNLRYSPEKAISKHFAFDALELRYAWYRRTDGLTGNILSILLDMEQIRKHE